MDFSFAGHKLAQFQKILVKYTLKDWYIYFKNSGKVNFEALVHLLRYIRDNKTLVLKYYADMHDALVSNLLGPDSIKTDNYLMAFSDSSWQDFPDTGRSTGTYIILYQRCPIYHVTQVHKLSKMQHALQECL